MLEEDQMMRAIAMSLGQDVTAAAPAAPAAPAVPATPAAPAAPAVDQVQVWCNFFLFLFFCSGKPH